LSDTENINRSQKKQKEIISSPALGRQLRIEPRLPVCLSVPCKARGYIRTLTYSILGNVNKNM